MHGAGSTSRGGQLRMPRYDVHPFRAIAVRVLIGCAVLLLIAELVWLDREGYSDLDDEVSFLDAVYYATVSASTTGFGDIAPVSDRARLVNTLVVTPLRLVFLAVLVGTTVEVLTRSGRDRLRVARWRRGIHGHTVVLGFGVKGRGAADRLLREGTAASDIVAVTDRSEDVAEATARGIVAVRGDATRDEVVLAAALDRASRVIITVPTDASTVLVCLTARRLNPTARIVGSVKEHENVELLRASGADSVIVSADGVGRQLATSLLSPAVGELYGQLLNPGEGVELVERPVHPQEVGRRPADLLDRVLAVVRDGVLRTDLRTDLVLAEDDLVLLVQPAVG